MVVTNNNGLWIGWLYLLTSTFTISLNHNQLRQLTINDCLRLAPFWLDHGWLPLWLTWFRFTNDLVLVFLSTATAFSFTNGLWVNSFSSQSHIATDGQSVSKSWCWAPDIYYRLTVMVLFLWGALSDERPRLSFVYAAGPCQRSLSRVRVPWDSLPYFTVSVLTLPFRRLAGSRWRYSTPPSHGSRTHNAQLTHYVASVRTA
jgi:hypothetical protein